MRRPLWALMRANDGPSGRASHAPHEGGNPSPGTTRAYAPRPHPRKRAPTPQNRPAPRGEQIAERADKAAMQIARRLPGQKITDRLVSISDPDARPIHK